MTTQHTPAPWLHGEHGDGAAITDAAGHRIASLAYGKQSVSMTIPVEQSLANARLIVAAPDLLEAVTDLLAWVAGQQRGGFIKKGLSFPAAEAAVAKARGDT